MSSNDLDRDKLDDSDAADADYELEPPDPAVVAAAEQRAAETVERLKGSIDIDEIYRDLEAGRDTEILEAWLERLRSRRFQFQLKHLLVLTAVVAILLTLSRLGMHVITLLVVAVMLFIGGMTLYLQWQERKRMQEVDRRRERMYAERRAALSGKPLPATAPMPPDELEAARGAAVRRSSEFRFSLIQLLAAMTSAALLLGLINVLGGPANVALLCGLFALGGLAVHALGYEPPEFVTFVWWIALLLYIGLSTLAALWSGIT